MKKLVRKLAIFMATFLVVGMISPTCIKAENFATATFVYKDKSMSRQFFDTEVEQIKAGVTTEGINAITGICNGISFSVNNEAVFDTARVTNDVKNAIISGKTSIAIDLSQYIQGATPAAPNTALPLSPVTQNAASALASVPAVTPAAGIVKISECTTKFNPGQDRATNVRSAAAHINGITLQPGQGFSANLFFTPRTVANGYGLGDILSGGTHVKAMGGGICQVSSTLNVAVLKAGIIPTERHNHSSHIGYLASGLDATISSGTYDYQFFNTLQYPITIAATTAGGVLNVSLYSDARALGGIVYEPVVIGSHNSSTTYVVGKLNGIEVSRRVAYSSRYTK